MWAPAIIMHKPDKNTMECLRGHATMVSGDEEGVSRLNYNR